MDSKDGAAAAASGTEGSRLLRFIRQAPVQCLLVAGQLALSFYGVREEPRRTQLLATITLCYAAAVALTLFARRLDAASPARRGREWWMMVAARFLASLVSDILPNRLAEPSMLMLPTTLLFAFIWIW